MTLLIASLALLVASLSLYHTVTRARHWQVRHVEITNAFVDFALRFDTHVKEHYDGPPFMMTPSETKRFRQEMRQEVRREKRRESQRRGL